MPMSTKPCTRFAVRMRFADEDAPRWIMCIRDHVISVHSVEPPLNVCHADEQEATWHLQHAGTPWSLPLAEAPHVVEVDVTRQLEARFSALQDELESIREELAVGCSYPAKVTDDAKL